jgi:hypothetical protein
VSLIPKNMRVGAALRGRPLIENILIPTIKPPNKIEFEKNKIYQNLFQIIKTFMEIKT